MQLGGFGMQLRGFGMQLSGFEMCLGGFSMVILLAVALFHSAEALGQNNELQVPHISI